MPTKSSYADIELPNTDIWGLLFERKDREYPDDKVIYLCPYTDRSYTYAQVKETAIDFGKGLKALWDWEKGDVLALYTPNSIDTPPVIWGCHWAGGVVSPANPGYTAKELAYQLKDSGAKALVTQAACLGIAVEAAKEVGLPQDRIILIGDERDKTAKFKHFTSIRNISGATRYRRTKRAPDDLAFLVYSSGTTGLPKGVMLSHENITSNLLQIVAGERGQISWKGGKYGTGDKYMGFLPFFHIYGQTALIHFGLYSGVQIVVMPKFDIEDFCRIIQDHKITFCYLVPPVILLLSKHPCVDKYDLSSLRMLTSGAAPLTKDLVLAAYKRIKVPIRQAYGLSETSPSLHSQPWDEWQDFIGSVGRLLPNLTAKYMSPEDKEVAAGEVGELWVKGPNIFKGYWNNPEGTANALTDDGYFKTGDVGFQDKRGHFYITDRVKELIKYKGFQVPPAELEGMLITNPMINDVAVVGIYDKNEATEVPRAYVVLSEGTQESKQTEKAIVDWMRSKVASHKRLRGGVRFEKEIPKSVSGKILRRMLKLKAQEEDDQPKAKL